VAAMIKRAFSATIILAIVTGCGGPSLSKNQRAEVESISEDFAEASSSAKTPTVNNSEIESKIDDLESRIADMGTEIDSLRKQNVEDAHAAAELERRINEISRGR
jgi:peptidoglycan hydrolase CwlO-like protein